MIRQWKALAAENGAAVASLRVAGSAMRRFRDRSIAAHLGTTGFHVGRHPRLLGLKHMRVGKNFSAGDSLWLEAILAYAHDTYSPVLTIGDNVNLSDRVHIACLHAVTIGDGVLMGSNIIVTDHAHGKYRGSAQSSPDSVPGWRALDSAGPVVIESNVWLGDGVCVLAGAHIGAGSVIGANSVVNGRIPPRTLAVGAPARPVRQWNDAAGAWLPLPRKVEAVD